MRFPRFAPSAEAKLDPELAMLEDFAFRLIARHSEVRLELGRLFRRIKAKVRLSGGRWTEYFARTFKILGFTLRTAERCMKLARASEAVAHSKNDNLSIFPPASDSQAVEIREATTKAEATVGGRPKGNNPLFKLPLLLSAEEGEAARALIKSSEWPNAHREIVNLLNQLSSKFRAVNYCSDALAVSIRMMRRGRNENPLA
jgi:hypothetical protein